MLNFNLFSFLERKVEIQDQVYGNTQKRMGFPYEPLSVTFDEVRYSVDMPAVRFLSFLITLFTCSPLNLGI